jgi:Zn-dependent protease
VAEIQLGTVAGLRLSAKRSAVFGFGLLWVLLCGAAILLFQVPIREAIVGGLIAVVLHYCSEIVHNLGHAWAARRTGYPMVGVRLFGVLGMSLYPRDEPPLPADVHIRRALGGPAASLLLTILTAVVALALRSTGGTPWLVAAFVFLENLFVFTLGALLPLGFTDGSTLLEWWNKR